jgi:lysyl-tRNA synthetase class 2
MSKQTAPMKNLRARARLLQLIRNFFAQREVFEVETPLFYPFTASDPHIGSFSLNLHAKQKVYLQTSPEFAMKRLLASGSGSIFQICKAFRAEERGRFHQPEFTMLEWYRVGFDHHQLMDEMDALLQFILQSKTAERFTYAELFNKYFNIDPHRCAVDELVQCAQKHQILVNPHFSDDKDQWLHLLMAHGIEPYLGFERPTFVMDFPVSQAALAKIIDSNPPVAARFEVYVNGVELANGYHELTDGIEQKRRVLADNQRRLELGLPTVPPDELLFQALNEKFPECAGVAMGVDRLLMLAMGAETIDEVISFVFNE